jgi:DNA-binding Lrp family transcriptional regulator
MTAIGDGLEPRDRELLLATQAGLPCSAQPYRDVARQLGWSEDEVLERLRRMATSGALRRVAAVPNHYRLGYTANAMTVWDVADEWVDEVGRELGALPAVSHCYRRPRRLPVWPYNLFAMFHGHSRAEVEAAVAVVADGLGDRVRSFRPLWSTRILKKTGLRLRPADDR